MDIDQRTVMVNECINTNSRRFLINFLMLIKDRNKEYLIGDKDTALCVYLIKAAKCDLWYELYSGFDHDYIYFFILLIVIPIISSEMLNAYQCNNQIRLFLHM